MLLVGAALCLLLSACSSGSSPAQQVIEPEPVTVGQVYQLCVNSNGQDTDGDSIPDDVELNELVQTNPNLADSDFDGVGDVFEVFGRSFLFVVTDGKAGELHEEDPLFDANENGIQAAIDSAETSEEFMVDSDGDGVYNYLEYYGYTYDWTYGEFVMWTEADRLAHPETPWFRTDPLQASTDQDAYPDGMEVSELLMDVAVADPGRHPLVPAVPNIVVRLEGYQVTLNDDITYEDGGSISQGYSWSRETESTSSLSQNVGVEVGAEVGYDDGFTAKGHVDVNWGIQWGNTYSSSKAIGSSVNEEINWNKARSHNASQAARVKLLLKIENHGAAPASNVVPTINLSIGGAAVATFRPSNLKVNMLMPGAVYPEGDSYWVVSETENGPIMLTDWELRALETGAPVQIFVTQVDADVMLLNGSGNWESAGDVNEYMARCEAVGATIFADLGDGDFMHYRVYACDGPTAPEVTLRDALAWCMGCTEVDGETYLEKKNPDGSTQMVQISSSDGEGWSIHMQKTRLDSLGPDEEPFDLVLRSHDHIELIPPRDVAETAPRIYSAYAVPVDGGYAVTACANDAEGVAEVVFLDSEGTEHEMLPDGRGPWFFSCNLEEGYEFLGGGVERVVVTSVNESVAEAAVDVEVIHTVISRPPYVAGLVYDPGEYLLQVTAEPGSGLPQDAINYEGSWPRCYHPDFPNGYIPMTKTIYWFEEPNVYECVVPFHPDEAVGRNMRVVAGSIGGQYTTVEVKNPDRVKPHAYGEFNIECVTFYPAYAASMYAPYINFDYHYPGVLFPDPLHHAPEILWYQTERYMKGGDGAWFLDHDGGWPADELEPFGSGMPADSDVYLRSTRDVYHASDHRLGFVSQWGGVKATVTGKSPDTFFHELTRQEIIDNWSDLFQPGVTDETKPKAGDVFVFRTTEGRYGKLLIKGTPVLTIHERFLVFWPQLAAYRVEGVYVIFEHKS